MKQSSGGREIGLFITCLANTLRPSVGFAALRLLRDAGFTVHVPMTQTCCGQPGYNTGDSATARSLGERVIAAFEQFDHVVAPSGSCVGMLKVHLADVFRDDAAWAERHAAFAAKCHELLSFLVDVAGYRPAASYDGKVTYHHSCSGLRELGVKAQAEALVGGVDGVSFAPLRDHAACCGFGGTFCVKYADISTAIVDDKIDDVVATGADTLLGGDLGCLLNIQGRLARRGVDVKVFHTAEVLAGMADAPLGRGDDR